MMRGLNAAALIMVIAWGGCQATAQEKNDPWKGRDFVEVRKQLLADGWRPIKGNYSWETREGDWKDEPGERFAAQHKEIVTCIGGHFEICRLSYVRSGKCLSIITERYAWWVEPREEIAVINWSNDCPRKKSDRSLFAKDIRDARKMLLAQGWKPLRTNKRWPDGTYQNQEANAGMLFDAGFIEVENCTGIGDNHCNFNYAKAEQCLALHTIGEYIPDIAAHPEVINWSNDCPSEK
jgi:hypothetical protein